MALVKAYTQVVTQDVVSGRLCAANFCVLQCTVLYVSLLMTEGWECRLVPRPTWLLAVH